MGDGNAARLGRYSRFLRFELEGLTGIGASRYANGGHLTLMRTGSVSLIKVTEDGTTVELVHTHFIGLLKARS